MLADFIPKPYAGLAIARRVQAGGRAALQTMVVFDADELVLTPRDLRGRPAFHWWSHLAQQTTVGGYVERWAKTDYYAPIDEWPGMLARQEAKGEAVAVYSLLRVPGVVSLPPSIQPPIHDPEMLGL